jgi:hypothetical protein
VLHPAGLSLLGVGALLQTALSEIPHAEFTAAAYAATGGNPFLVRELATALIERQLRPTTQAAADVSTIGPEGVQRAILRRLAALGPGAKALARAVAVLGSGSELRHAAGLSRISDRQALQLVESLVRVQILRDEPQLAFVHPLVRAAIYADMTAGARAQAHAEAAAILDRDGADVNIVAAHLLESPALGSADVVEHLRMAARRAASHGAMDVASSYLRRACAEPPRESQRPAVLRELGTAELAAGQPNEAAERLAAAAAMAEDFDSRVSIVLMRRHALVLADRIAEAVSIVDDQRAEPAAKTYADLLEAAAIGAGQLDFAVARSVEPRLNELRSRARTSELTEPLALAVAASSNALANGDLELTTTLAERAVGSMAAAHPQSDYTVEGQIAVALYLSERYDQLAELSSRWLDDARRWARYHGSSPWQLCAPIWPTVPDHLWTPRRMPTTLLRQHASTDIYSGCQAPSPLWSTPSSIGAVWTKPSGSLSTPRSRKLTADHRLSAGRRCSFRLGVGYASHRDGPVRGSLTYLPAGIATNRGPIARRRSGPGARSQRLCSKHSGNTPEQASWRPPNWRSHGISAHPEPLALR